MPLHHGNDYYGPMRVRRNLRIGRVYAYRSEGLTYREIAEGEGVSIERVRQMVGQACRIYGLPWIDRKKQ